MAEKELALPAEDEGLVFEEDETGVLNINGTATELHEMLGTSNRHAAGMLLSQIASVVDPSSENMPVHLTAIAPMLKAIAPTNELEAMLAIQMIGTHYMALAMMRRAMLTDQTADGIEKNVNRSTKLTRTFLSQMEALDKHRGKGGQKVRVEHIHINEGGQAIVGNVGGGVKSEK